MRIVLLGPYPAEVGKPRGGVEVAMSTLASSLARMGDHRVRVVDPFTGYGPVSPQGFEVIRLKRLGRWRSGAVTVPRRVRNAIRDFAPDVIHVHLGAQYARLSRASVLTVHGSPHLETIIRNPGLRGRLASVVLERPFRSGLRRAGLVIAISDDVRRLADEVGSKSMVISNPVADVFFSADRAPGDDFVSVGEILRLKNQRLLIEGFEHYVRDGGRGNLILAGGIGDAAYMSECRRVAADLRNRVQFIGAVDQHALADLLARSRASITTSLRETSSIALAESLAVGCPVVTLDVGTARHQITAPQAGIVLPVTAQAEDVAQALWAVSKLAQEPNSVSALVAHQHPDAIARQTLRAYEEVVGPGAGPNTVGRRSRRALNAG